VREGDIGAPTGAGTFDRAFGPVVVSGSRLSPFGAVEKRPDGDRARQPPVHCGERERRFGSVRPRHQHIGTAMITLASGTRVWLAVGRTDMRKAFDGLSALVQEKLAQDPFCGRPFVFRGRGPPAHGLDGVDGPSRHRCADVGSSTTPTDGTRP